MYEFSLGFGVGLCVGFSEETSLPLISNLFPLMQINKKVHDAVVVLSLEGTLFGGPQSLSLCTTFRELLEHNRTQVVLEISRLSWMSIAGTGILISALTSFRNNGGDLKLAGASEEVKEQLEKASFNSIFAHYDQVDAAIAGY